jgi:hypothetical protein
MVKPLIAGELISAIVPESKEAFEKTDDLILAVQCLAEVTDLNQIADVAEQVLEGLCGWFEKTKKIQFAHVSKKEYDFENKAIPAVEVIGKNWPRRKKFISWLSKPDKEIAGFDGVQAFGKMVTALWSDHWKAREELVKLTETTEISLGNLALETLLKSQKEAKLLLQQLAVGSHYENIRFSAINILVRYHSKASDTKLLLRQVATNDTDNFIRLKAIKHLVKYYSEASDTLPLLQKIATDDPNSSFRLLVIDNFPKHYSDASDTLQQRLQQLAIQDPDESNRRNLVGRLAKHYYNETWQKLLSENFFGINDWSWLDSKAIIDEERVEEAAEELELSPETIRQHYEDIAKEIPLRLAWKV